MAVQAGLLFLSVIILSLIEIYVPENLQSSGWIGAILLFSFFFLGGNFFIKFWVLRKSVHDALRFLKSRYPSPDSKVLTGQEVSELSRYFSSNAYLAHAWQEFRGGIVVDESSSGATPTVFNSDNSHAFFDEYAVIESNMFPQFWVNLPGMFTAGGILGTFYGLVETLQGIKGGEDEQAALGSVMQALPGMHTAFYCSLLGVGLYIAFSLG
jgi:hypothetical protein